MNIAAFSSMWLCCCAIAPPSLPLSLSPSLPLAAAWPTSFVPRSLPCCVHTAQVCCLFFVLLTESASPSFSHYTEDWYYRADQWKQIQDWEWGNIFSCATCVYMDANNWSWIQIVTEVKQSLSVFDFEDRSVSDAPCLPFLPSRDRYLVLPSATRI